MSFFFLRETCLFLINIDILMSGKIIIVDLMHYISLLKKLIIKKYVITN